MTKYFLIKDLISTPYWLQLSYSQLRKKVIEESGKQVNTCIKQGLDSDSKPAIILCSPIPPKNVVWVF